MTKKPVTEYVQVQLMFVDDENFVSRLTCMLPNRPNIKVGNRVSLADWDDPERMWDIKGVSRPIPVHSVHREWNNNI